MEQLSTILISVNPETGEFISAQSKWTISGKLSGYDAATDVFGDVIAKPITDQLKQVIQEVITQGPPAPAV